MAAERSSSQANAPAARTTAATQTGKSMSARSAGNAEARLAAPARVATAGAMSAKNKPVAGKEKAPGRAASLLKIFGSPWCRLRRLKQPSLLRFPATRCVTPEAPLPLR